MQARILQLVSTEADARLLQHFLPDAVIRKLKGGGLPFSERVPEATFLFADIVGFTTMCSVVDAAVVVNLLHTLFSALDEATGKHSVFKVDTIGVCAPPCTGPARMRNADAQSFLPPPSPLRLLLPSDLKRLLTSVPR